MTPLRGRHTLHAMRVFLAGLLILILPTIAIAQATGQILSIGFNNFYRPDCWTPMLIQLVSGSDQSTTYQIQVKQEDLDHDRVIYSQDVTLGGNVEGKPATTENFWIYFRPKPTERGLPDATDLNTNLKTLNSKLKVFLCDKNGKQLSILPCTSTIISVDPYREALDPHRTHRLVLMVTDGADQPIMPDYSQMKGVLEDVDAVPVHPADLPSNVIGYEAVDAIVWMDADATFLTAGTRAPALEAIRQWVHQGGHLVICQPPEPFKIKPFADLLPVGGLLDGEWAIPMFDRKDVDILNQLAHPSGIGVAWPATTATAKVARVPALPDAKVEEWIPWTDDSGTSYSPWLARRGIGLGAVTWVAQDLGNRAVTENAKTGWRFIWDRVFDWNNATNVPENFNPILAGVNDPWAESQWIDLGASTLENIDLASTAAKKIGFAVLFFLVYGVAAGLGTYFFLLSRKKEHLSWFYFCFAAVIATGLSAVLVKIGAGGAPQLRHLSILRYAEGEPNAVIDSRFGLYVPADGSKSIELQHAAPREVSYIAPLPMHPQFVSNDDDANGSYIEYEIPVRDASNLDSITASIDFRSTSKKFQTHWVGPVKGAIEVPSGFSDLKLVPKTGSGGYITGALVNHSGYDLGDVYLAFKEPMGFDPQSTYTRDADWLIYLPQWPKDTVVNFADVMKPENQINMDRDSGRRPLSKEPAFGEISINGRAWDRFWKDKDRDLGQLQFGLPVMALFDRILPWRLDVSTGGASRRYELYHRNARELNLSPALSAGQMVIVATARVSEKDDSQDQQPLPVPLTVAGDPVTGSGRVILEYVLSLDKTQMYQQPATRPATRP
ncbi:MAG: hypothetical protein M3O30_04470 [Planctomycetota bacterium]|nr:hypothetical protein [Planctomycetota bacterium]